MKRLEQPMVSEATDEDRTTRANHSCRAFYDPEQVLDRRQGLSDLVDYDKVEGRFGKTGEVVCGAFEQHHIGRLLLAGFQSLDQTTPSRFRNVGPHVRDTVRCDARQ